MTSVNQTFHCSVLIWSIMGCTNVVISVQTCHNISYSLLLGSLICTLTAISMHVNKYILTIKVRLFLLKLRCYKTIIHVSTLIWTSTRILSAYKQKIFYAYRRFNMSETIILSKLKLCSTEIGKRQAIPANCFFFTYY